MGDNLDKPLDDLSLNMEVIRLEDLLEQYALHPQSQDETISLSSRSVLKLLGMKQVSRSEVYRAAIWFRQNGFRASVDGKRWKVKLGIPPVQMKLII